MLQVTFGTNTFSHCSVSTNNYENTQILGAAVIEGCGVVAGNRTMRCSSRLEDPKKTFLYVVNRLCLTDNA
jgi:hypothetical protein